MTTRFVALRPGLILIGVASCAFACSKPSHRVVQAPRAPADSAPSFVNKVWKVSRSSGVEVGALYVFLSDGTLLIASSHGTPSLGRWAFVSDTLTLVEEGIPHRANVLRLGSGELSIRFADHGAPLDITFTPATGHAPWTAGHSSP